MRCGNDPNTISPFLGNARHLAHAPKLKVSRGVHAVRVQKVQRWARWIRKSRKACTRATVFISSG